MRIAVLNKEHCKPKDCNYKCVRMCPINKTGKETIVVDEESKKPQISESLCTGCGICVKKCPFGAIHIINLPEELDEPIHQYGVNGFRLYNIPVPREGVVGLVGSNGIGKTTALRILAGELKPNLGGDADWSQILEYYRGHEIQDYFKKLSEGDLKAVYKPQYVESIPDHVDGTVSQVLNSVDERGAFQEIVSGLDIESILDRGVDVLSGGELQRMAIAACLLRDADIYLIDEPGSYLDVRERLRTAKAIRSMGDRRIMVVEHDLVVLDYLSDYIHVFFGEYQAYGIVSGMRGVRNGINEYLGGFLSKENMRFRDPIKFDVKPASESRDTEETITYPGFNVELGDFKLTTTEGKLHVPEVVGILGPNATGKTTYVKALIGEVSPEPELDLDLEFSYKPQYIETTDELVAGMDLRGKFVDSLELENLLNKTLNELSGGELQRVAIARCLSREADIYLLDEPSAYLDVEQRLNVAKLMGDFSFDEDKNILVVDHDVLLIDYLSSRLMVFEGTPSVEGHANPPMGLEEGMNEFLSQIDITFRRDSETGRPRANKPGSVKDRKQKKQGNYYYE